MHRHLRVSLTAFLIAIMAIIIMVIASSCAIQPKYPEFRSECGQNAILAITSVKGQFPTRVLYGKIKDSENDWHVYGQIYFNGEWLTLGVPVWATIKSGVREHELENPIAFTGKQYMDRWARTLRDREKD